MMKYPGTDLQTYNLDWVIQEVKRLAKANGIEFNDENIHIGADNVQEAIDALYDLIMEISGQTNAVEVIDSTILESTWSTGYTYTHLQTVNTPTLMAIVNAMRLSKSIILRRDIATNDEAAFVLLEVNYDPILFKHELKLVNPYIHRVATLNIYGLDDDANFYAEILPDVTVKYVNTFNGRSGNVTPASHDYDAEQVDYDNTTSGLSATDTQSAIDEVNNNIPHTANLIGYDNTGSGLQAENVQAAIDEVDDKIPSNIVETFNGRTGTVTPASHDYNAKQIDYNNTTSGLSATDVQAAIDELVANPPAPVAADINYTNTTSGLQATNVQDALDEIANDVLSSGVASFNGRTGAVNPAAHDYDADQIDYDNTTSGLSATDTQGAIDELAGDIEELSDVATQTSTGNPVSITTDSRQVARDTKITLLPIQASGTPTPSNPIPISGYDSVSLDVTGTNVWNEQWEVGEIDDTTGADKSSTTRIRSKGYIPVVSGQTYYVLNSLIVFGYDRNKTPVTIGSGTLYTVKSNQTFTIPQGVSFVRFYPASGSYGTTYTNDISINYPSTDTSYHAYASATQISLPLPSTVYGGELDVEKGVLKVEFVKETLTWGNGTNKTNLGTVTRATFTLANYAREGVTVPNKCSVAPKDVNYSSDTTHFYVENGQKQVWMFLPNDTDNDTQFDLVYGLATPYEIQLTPYEVELLQGANVITTNGTNLTLVWREGSTATLSDIPAETTNKLSDLMADLDAKAVKQTSGELDAKLNANETAAAVLSNLMLRDIKIQTTAVTPGDDATEPDGTVIIVYEP